MAGVPEETAQFAATLRELKERSGRSYGQLAKRLHLSTSTLHRYCNGAALPAEYGTVERIARLCGATPDELLDLHRRWLLAHARRRAQAGQQTEPRPAEAVADPAVQPGTGSPAGDPPEARADEAAAAVRAETPPGEGGDAPRAEGTTARPDRPAPPDPATPPGRSAPGDPATLRDPAVPQDPAALHAPAARAEHQRPAESVTGTSTGTPPYPPPGHRVAPDAWGTSQPVVPAAAHPSRPGRRLWQERRVVLGVVGVVTAALLAGVVVALSPVAGDGDDADGPRSGGPSASEKAEKAAEAEPPLAVEVRSHTWTAGCGHTYLTPREPGAVPSPPVEQDARSWADALGAVHGDGTNVEITVQGTAADAVVLRALRARVVERRSPPSWNAYAMDQGCGGALTPAVLALDLDVPRPRVRPVDGYDASGTGVELPAREFPLRVSRTDPEVLLVQAEAEGCDCDWYLELDWASAGRTGTLRVDDNGRPFRTSSAEGRPTYVYGQDGEWERSAEAGS